MNDREPGTRLHAFDALRASMMLLGLVQHSWVTVELTPWHDRWHSLDAATKLAIDALVFIINTLRMPVFFVMAGVFAAMLYDREGGPGFVRHRIRRLLLPLAVAWALVLPITWAGYVYLLNGGAMKGLGAAAGYLSHTPFADPTPVHIWFLYYLTLMSLSAAVVVPIVRRLPLAVRRRAMVLFGRIAGSWWGALVGAAITLPTLLPMRTIEIERPPDFVPVPRILLAYTVFLIFGWLLYQRRDIIARFARHPWRLLVAGTLLGLAYKALLSLSIVQPQFRPAGVLIGAAAIWWLSYGVIGLYVKYWHAPNAWRRYLSDGSYWMYLIHMPVAIWIAGALEGLAWPAVAKYLAVLTATAAIAVVTYHWFVRATPIGAFLNGRRYPRRARRIDATIDAWPMNSRN